MVEISEKEWKKALTSILEELTKTQYEKFLEHLNRLPQSVKEETSREKMPGKMIEYYGLKESVSATNEALEQIPRRDEDVQNLLRPFMDWLKAEKENQESGLKRKLNEVEEESSAAGKKKKLSELNVEQTSAAARFRGEQNKVVEEESLTTGSSMSCRTTEVKSVRTNSGSLDEGHKVLFVIPEQNVVFQEESRPAWKISIRDLKSRDQPPETGTFYGKVIKKSELRSFKNKDGGKRVFFDVGVADETACIKVKFYKKELYKEIQEGRSYMFRNWTRDQDVIKMTKLSRVAQIRAVQVSEELEMEARKLIYPEPELYSIHEAKKCPDRTVLSVEGTVEEIPPAEETKVSHQRQKIKTQHLKLRDETGSIWTCMWGEETRQCRGLSLGDVVKMTNVRTNHYHGDMKLNSTASTRIHKVQSLGVLKVKVHITGITKATKRMTHLEAELDHEVHTFVVASPLLMKALEIKEGSGLRDSLVEKLPFIANAEIRGNRIKKIKVVSTM